MSDFLNARTGLSMADTIITGLEAIGILSKTRGDQAEAALDAIQAIYHTLVAGSAGTLSPAAITDALKTLTAGVASSDAGADAKLLARFHAELGLVR